MVSVFSEYINCTHT